MSTFLDLSCHISAPPPIPGTAANNKYPGPVRVQTRQTRQGQSETTQIIKTAKLA